MWGARCVMQKKKNSMLRNRIGILMPVLLLCFGLLAGCGKKAQKTIQSGSEQGNTPAVTATPTPSPTPVIPYFKTAYETAGRDDVYRVSVQELGENNMIMDTFCAGDYVLLWLVPNEAFDADKMYYLFVLLKPSVGSEKYKITMDFAITEPKLLADGTVVVEDHDTGVIHVYDNTLKEIKTFDPTGAQAPTMIGVSDDGIIWNADAGKAKLLATDLNGQLKGAYSYDTGFMITRYLGRSNAGSSFLAVIPGTTDFQYLYISDDGKVSYRNENENALGSGWISDGYAPYAAPLITTAPATWFLHAPGYMREAIAFPKSAAQEEKNFWQDGKFCSCAYRRVDETTCYIDYRIYDTEAGTVSGVLSDQDIADTSYLSAEGTIGKGIVVFFSSKKSGGTELLLWDAGEKASPITGFCDFSKDNPEDSLKALLKEAEQADIKITPDRMKDDGSNEALGDIMAEMDLINTFLFTAKTDPEVLKTKSGNAVQPENGSNNDGSHYTFNPHVFSTFYLKEHGTDRRDIFFRYVDALRAGADGFECPNEGYANWSSGKFANMFFPVAGLYADAEYVGNGWAQITYKIPKEEFLEKERDFEKRIEAILNDVLEDDYTEFEKALALYEFLTEYTVYDYEMMEHNEEWADRQSSYRVLTEKRGICGEIAILYQYLALQCGVDMDECVGMPVNPADDMHAWDYIKLDGKGYLIDATWGMTAKRMPILEYFLFTDELREKRDGYSTDSVDVGFNGLYGARKVYSFEAVDTRYSALWEGSFVAFDENEKCIFYRDRDGAMHRFDYGEAS